MTPRLRDTSDPPHATYISTAAESRDHLPVIEEFQPTFSLGGSILSKPPCQRRGLVSATSSPFTAPAFDSSGLKPFYAKTAAAGPARSVKAGLDRDRQLRRRATRRRFVRLSKVAAAVEHLGVLPEPGEYLHGVMHASFDGFDLVPAVLKLAEPATIARLDIATLGFNRENAESLFGLMDQGDVGEVTFICSTYFQAVDKDIFACLNAGLVGRGQRCVVCRTHAKLLLFELTDGRHYAVESSANLRSCRNVEQFTMTEGADLVGFHRDWIEYLIQETLRCEAESPNQRR